ncbi:replication protein A 70 kDa DNA-binding subunit A-like [Apium graveolens]|uniref:replication protein A 70 kDa DNA-binding subunit A-like n=1 Tax=Apium graveolens TaxID=4045 RepID=UPI003D7968EF
MTSALTSNTENHTIRVRVGLIWEAINKKTKMLLDTNIILLDEHVCINLTAINHINMNEAMVVTLWEARAKQFLEVFTPSNDGPVFVVITSLLAKKFSDAASLSSTDGTCSYVNIDYPPLNALKNGLTTGSTGEKEPLPTPTVEQFVTSNVDRVQELTVNSILETVIPDGTQVVRCICRTKIVGILDGNGWYYNYCPTCARTLRALDGAFLCLACDEEIPSLAQRFRIVVQIEDQAGSTTVTLFNKDAKQLVGVPLQKLLDEAGELKITPYNIIQGCEEYTVTRVSELNGVDSGTANLSHCTSAGNPVGPNSRKKQKVT